MDFDGILYRHSRTNPDGSADPLTFPLAPSILMRPILLVNEDCKTNDIPVSLGSTLFLVLINKYLHNRVN